jgi:hypothetical protein
MCLYFLAIVKISYPNKKFWKELTPLLSSHYNTAHKRNVIGTDMSRTELQLQFERSMTFQIYPDYRLAQQ